MLLGYTSGIISLQFNPTEGPTLSNSQQEIATPNKACKQRKRSVILVIFALIFVSLAAVGCILLRDNAVAIMLIVIVLAIALAVIAIIAVKDNIKAIKLILDILTGGIALIIILRFALTINESNKLTNLIYIATTATMAILLICLNIVKEQSSSSKRTTKYLTYTATFVALSVIFKMLGNTLSSIVIIPNMKLSFVYIPWVISGIVLGPVGGVLTALIGDTIGQLTIMVGGAINPLTSLSNALFPLAPALIFKLVKKGPAWLKLAIGMTISLIVCTMGIGSYSLYTYYNYGATMNFWTYLATIRSPQLIIIAVNYFLCLLLLPTVSKMRLAEKLKQD